LGDRPSVADAAVWGNLHMLDTARPGTVERVVPALASWYVRAGSTRAL
jgi:glutathione S-transferase